MLYSPASLSTVRSPDQEQAKGFWKNRVQHLFFFLGYCVNLRSFASFIHEDGMKNPEQLPTFLQTALMCVAVGGPLVFIQMFIGQFTQKGSIALGSMVPAMYGFGYCMMIIALLDCVENVFYCSGGLLYLLTAILNYPYPAWMYCSSEMYEADPNCFSRVDIDLCESCSVPGSQPCYERNSKTLSATLFRYLVAFEKDISIQDPLKIGPPQVKSVSHVFLVTLFVYIITCRRLKSLDLSLRISLVFCLLGVIGTAVVALADRNTWTALRTLVHVNVEAFGDLTAWLAAFRRVTEALKISCGGHILLGSYMMPDTASHFRTVYLIGYFILIVFLFYCHYYLIEILLHCRFNMGYYGDESAGSIIFVSFPTQLGLTASPQLWCTLYFTVYCILSIISVVLQVVLMDETLSDEFKIGEYYMYTRCAICILIFILCLPLTTKGGMFVAQTLHHEMKVINLLVITVTFIIIFLYNIQRLKDDIHFVLNTPPTWYIQTFWISTAFVSGIMFLYQIDMYDSENHFYMVRGPIYFLVGSPFFIGFFVKLVQYLRKQNITAIFRPSVYYGPPDLTTRLMRVLFNPRLEVRYSRRKELCKHRCLLNNEIAARAIEKELQLIMQIAEDLLNSEEYRGDHANLITTLLEHHKVMYIRFAMFVRQAIPNAKLYS